VHEPAYLALSPAELARRARDALSLLASPCRVCPRRCKVERLSGRAGFCRSGRLAEVASVFPHHGEEDCLRGRKGSGTIFFSGCNLGCVFCQNWEISHEAGGEPVSAEELAALMLTLQGLGCHNLNFVTPEHVVPQILEALPPAVGGGLRLPIVYNTSAFDSPECLALLDGIVDVYMPDFKLWSAEACRRYLRRRDYAEVARASLLEMQRQVGPLDIGEDGLARRGLLIRHLVMPGLGEESEEILRWIASELGPGSYVNVMAQYHPAGRVLAGEFPELARPLERGEHARALGLARELGLRTDERR
jgi:putative pyruvate formate lyase activating enzyme